MMRKMFIEIRLCNPMTYIFKGHVKIIKIYMVKFNVSILNRLKIIFFCTSIVSVSSKDKEIKIKFIAISF